MITRTPLLRIRDMLEAIRGIDKALAGKTIRDYERSWLLRSAVERGIEIISEASRHLGSDLKAQHKDVRWKDLAGIGNILRHDYQRVDHLEGSKGRSAAAQGGVARTQGILEVARTLSRQAPAHRTVAACRLQVSANRRQETTDFAEQVGNGLVVIRQMLEQRALEQAVEQRVECSGRRRRPLAAQFGVARGDAPDHRFQALVDFEHVLAKRRL